ncbi:hypothetical protein T492DRAFT_837224 [Pavlovales sp. CCMP2436]|nr:hypothetical protein T492DRAFT_837224 [Pavlovales sp. CCMP2436]
MPALQVSLRFRTVPDNFIVHDLTHTVLGDMRIAFWADPRARWGQWDVSSEMGAVGTIPQVRRPRAVRLLFPSDDLAGVAVDGTSLPFGRTLLASSPGVETWATLERYICAEPTGRCRWSSEPAARAALDVDTRVRQLRLDSPAFSLTAARQQVLKSMPHWLAVPLEACGRRQAARVGLNCERKLFDAMVYSAHAPVSKVMGYIDTSLSLRNESCAPPPPGTPNGGSLAHAAHGLLGQRSCATLDSPTPTPERSTSAEPQGAQSEGGGHIEALPQGEGYITGVWTDYAVLGSLWSRRYTFNRFAPQLGARPAAEDTRRAADTHGSEAQPQSSPTTDEARA